MHRHSKKIVFWIIAIITAIAFVGFYYSPWLARRIHYLKKQPYSGYPSLIPQVQRTFAVRFDPSYYYRGERPAKLAETLARQWAEAGINLVFYRAYDPRFGSFYKTKYQLNEMGEFGRYDLLKEVMKACRRCGIRVFAWIPVLNHAGAWNPHPHWRSKTKNGEDYTEKGLEFPLCARNPEVRQWWGGFLDDFLENYPQIDGVDFGEPVVSWKTGQACYCEHCKNAYERHSAELQPAEIRAQALTELLTRDIARVHRAGKLACVTSVQPAWSDGELQSPSAYRNTTGFDLTAVLRAEDQGAPDIICPEFIWQEMKSRYQTQTIGRAVFTPEWTESAVQQFLQWLDTPIEVVAHLELTDFPEAPVTSQDLLASIGSALCGGAQGIDIYSSHLIDEKEAWLPLPSSVNSSVTRECLVLYDQIGLSDAIQVGELLRHFDVKVELRPIAEYSSGTLSGYDNIFYVGTDSEAVIPGTFLDDLPFYYIGVIGNLVICLVRVRSPTILMRLRCFVKVNGLVANY